MDISATDKTFAGGIPEIYERHMVPLFFEPYARDLAARLAPLGAQRVLELAAGTGVLTRHLARVLDPRASLVATDLNPQMIEQAKQRGTDRAVDWQVADALSLPFEDGSFDLVVCQFGAMFFPDKGQAWMEARRVLRPGGRLVFNVWDRIERNGFDDTVQRAVAALYERDPPSFMARVPHGYYDEDTIRADLRRGGFTVDAAIETLELPTVAPSPRDPAVAICQGTPMRHEIEAKGAGEVLRATEAAAAAVLARFGQRDLVAESRALLVSVVTG
ncbi:MAG TPA: methyltransferase domain-containing protein [Steroidobacteraceae bacterium]|nr:methyltransferase domain-containing protein [Steroidobacteraceae bacterium]